MYYVPLFPLDHDWSVTEEEERKRNDSNRKLSIDFWQRAHGTWNVHHPIQKRFRRKKGYLLCYARRYHGSCYQCKTETGSFFDRKTKEDEKRYNLHRGVSEGWSLLVFVGGIISIVYRLRRKGRGRTNQLSTILSSFNWEPGISFKSQYLDRWIKVEGEWGGREARWKLSGSSPFVLHDWNGRKREERKEQALSFFIGCRW